MPRFRKAEQFSGPSIDSLPTNPKERSVLCAKYLNLINSHIDKINNDFIAIIANNTLTAQNIRGLKYSLNADAIKSVTYLGHSEMIKDVTVDDIFSDNETTIPEGTKYPILRSIHNILCTKTRNFMNHVLHYLSETTQILVETHRIWEVLRLYRKEYSKIFQYLDDRDFRYESRGIYLRPHTNILISKLFYEIVYPAIHARLANELCNQFDIMRKDCLLDRTYVRAMAPFVKMCKRLIWYKDPKLDKLGYTNHFEKIYLERLTNYYAAEIEKWINNGNVFDYCNQARKVIAFETELCNVYIPNSHPEETIILDEYELLTGTDKQTYKAKMLENGKPRLILSKVRALLSNILLSSKSDYILSSPSGLETMFGADDEIGIKLVLNVFSQHVSTCHGLVAPVYKKYLANTMNDMLKSVAEPEFITMLSNFNQTSINFINNVFEGISNYKNVLRDVMVSGINSNETIIENIVVAIDNIIQGKNEKLSEPEQETRISLILEWFRYIHDKDVFAETYKQYLAKRLVNQKSSPDLERYIMTKLKSEAGISFTSKMENMISDVSNSNKSAYNAEFREYSKALALPALDFSPLVLTTGAWPSFPNIRTTLPPIMEQYVQAFKQFYEFKHDHRRLLITTSAGTITVELGRFEIQMIPLQAVVLLLFNDLKDVTVQTVADLTGMDIDTIRHMLHSLSCGKYKLLKKTPETATISSTDTFSANWEFTTPLRRFRMPVPNLNQTSINRAKITEDRTYAIEAAIVRIMKSRRVLGHQELVGIILEQLNLFKPDPKMIKMRIENLISREYMERDEMTPGLYKYVA